MKWGGITLPSLATAAKTITEAGFLLCITGGTSEGLKAIIRVFCLFATSSTTNFSRRQKHGHVLLCASDGSEAFGHLSALGALERVVRRLRTLLTYDFIPRSSLTALLMVLRLTLRFCASFDIGWLGSDFNVLFSPARKVLVLFDHCGDCVDFSGPYLRHQKQ